MARIELTEADMIRDLNEALGDVGTEGGYTTREIRRLTGWGKNRALDNMRTLVVAGVWEAIKVSRESPLDPGVTNLVRGYRPVVSRD